MHQIEEKEFLLNYNASAFKRPNFSIDTVILTIINDDLHVLVVKRTDHPFKNKWSLVGGYVDIDLDSNIEETAKRKLEEKTGIKTPYLEQFNTIGNFTRDPRGWTVTTVYFALISSINIRLIAGPGASEIKWTKVKNGKIAEELAFDHNMILDSCLVRLKSKVLYTSLPIHLMYDQFTLGELQKVYETILEKKIDHKSFRRRLLAANILEDTTTMRYDRKKPAKLYKMRESHKTYFFIRNIEGAR